METPREYRKRNRLSMLLAGLSIPLTLMILACQAGFGMETLLAGIVLFAAPTAILARPTGTRETADGQTGEENLESHPA